MKKIYCLTLLLIFTFSFGAFAKSSENDRKIALQTYTFSDLHLDELPAVLKELGISHIGASGGLKLSAKYPDVRFNNGMNAEQREYAKKIFADNKITIVSYGVVYSKTEGDVINLCKFAKEFGIPVVLTEDAPEQFTFWEKHGPEYGVKMALHNHAKDNKRNGYFDPKYVLSIIKDYKNILAGADNGHWARSGINSIEAYNVLKGKLAVIHIKDMNKFDELSARCVPFGKGVVDMAKVLQTLDAQKYDSYFVIEYEGTRNPVKEVAECIKFLREN